MTKEKRERALEVRLRATHTKEELDAEQLTVFQDLYDSEINFKVWTMWDGGFEVRLGDEMNGYTAEWVCDTMVQAASFLRVQALLQFPESRFAKKWAAPTPPLD